jgi:hypothetical protein
MRKEIGENGIVWTFDESETLVGVDSRCYYWEGDDDCACEDCYYDEEEEDE